MVKYWLMDGEVMATRWVNTGPEMPLEKLETVFGENTTNSWLCRHKSSLSEGLSFWWRFSIEGNINEKSM